MENGEKLQSHINQEVKEDLNRLYRHAEIANKEMGELRTLFGIVQSDVGWLKKFFWVIAGSSIGGLVTGILNLLFK